MTDSALWAIFTLLCRGNACEELSHRHSFETFAACDEVNARGHNFSDMVPRDAEVRWECMPWLARQ